MKPEDFNAYVTEFKQKMEDISSKKNLDYSAGSNDPLNDYKSAAARLNLSPIQAWSVLFTKHIHAVERFVKVGSVESEHIEDRLIDIANYAILGAALIKDLGDSVHELSNTNRDKPQSDKAVKVFTILEATKHQICPHCKAPISDEVIKQLFDKRRNFATCPECKKLFTTSGTLETGIHTVKSGAARHEE